MTANRQGRRAEPAGLWRRVGRVVGLLLLLPLASCSGDDRDRETLTVFAAASLAGPFADLEEEYEDRHPGVDVRISYAGSADLVTQVEEGAEVDVVALADEPTMDRLIASFATGPDPEVFATNTLILAVQSGNPRGIRDLDDLLQPDVDLVLCAPEVPCGRAAQEVADRNDIDFDPVSEEQSVTDVLAKVREGEADAGMVYATDVLAADGEVDGIALAGLEDVVNRYPIVQFSRTDQVALAGGFVDLVLSDAGQRVLADHGFGPPAP